MEIPGDAHERMKVQLKAFPLGSVLRACPVIAAYGPGGAVESWRDLMAAAVSCVRCLALADPPMKLVRQWGRENAAATIACILERAGRLVDICEI